MTSGLDALFATSIADAEAASRIAPFDAAIIGGGTAGIVAALTLAEAGRRVVLFEAGPLLLLTNVLDTDLRFNRTAQRAVSDTLSASPAAADGTPFGRLQYCLGGRGLFWTGATPRFDRSDFASWPISYDDVEPYYRWAETFFGVNDRMGTTTLAQLVIRRLRLAGYHDAAPGPTAIDRPGPLDDRVGGNIGNALGPLLRSPLFGGPAPRALTICTNAFATQVVHDGSNAHAVAVKAASGETASIAAKSVVLAAGGFESARLALVSGFPDRSGLMGRLICDHIFVRAFYPLPASYYSDVPEQAVVCVRANGRGFQLELHVPNDNLFALDPAGWAPAPTVDYSVMVRAFAPTQPRMDNWIEPLAGDDRARYRVHFAYSSDDTALTGAMQAELERVRAALPADAATVQTMPPGASHHESGGLAAGRDPAASVVDGFGRFHGLQNVVVADASAWPTSTPYNPHLTIAALARRQASALAERGGT